MPEIGGKIMPVSSQQIATAPLDPALAESLLPANYAVEDVNYVLDYYRRTADNRLLYGGGVGYGGGDPADLIAFLRPRMLKTFPQLEDTRIEFAWSGQFALTLTRIPHVGRLVAECLFLARRQRPRGDHDAPARCRPRRGDHRTSPAASTSGRASSPTPFPGGQALRVPLTALGAFWYDMRDRLGV